MTTEETQLVELFPLLHFPPARILAGEDDKYNCIAWAAGDTARFWWPDGVPEHLRVHAAMAYWPTGCPNEVTIEAFRILFGQLGYEVCASDVLEVSFERVAILVADGEPTHAMRQTDLGMWTSKIGQLPLIQHAFEDLCGEAYGTVHTIMRRPVVRQS